MLLKRVVLLGFILCLVLSSAYLVWSHCHNTDDCEDLVNDLVANEAWSNPNIDYKVNVLHNYGKDELRPTLAAARVAWSDLHFNDVDIEFSLHYAGTTYETPGGNSDGENTIGWVNLGNYEDAPLAYTYVYLHPTDSSQIIECDLGFNYYQRLDEHDDVDGTEYCLTDVATHEFGHWVSLKDLTIYSGCYSSYSHYTMWEETNKNAHWRESLRCEDKWGLWYTYHGGP